MTHDTIPTTIVKQSEHKARSALWLAFHAWWHTWGTAIAACMVSSHTHTWHLPALHAQSDTSSNGCPVQGGLPKLRPDTPLAHVRDSTDYQSLPNETLQSKSWDTIVLVTCMQDNYLHNISVGLPSETWSEAFGIAIQWVFPPKLAHVEKTHFPPISSVYAHALVNILLIHDLWLVHGVVFRTYYYSGCFFSVLAFESV